MARVKPAAHGAQNQLPAGTVGVPWLMQVVLAVSAYGLEAIDSVFNDFKDMEALDAECGQGVAMGFSGTITYFRYYQ